MRNGPWMVAEPRQQPFEMRYGVASRAFAMDDLGELLRSPGGIFAHFFTLSSVYNASLAKGILFPLRAVALTRIKPSLVESACGIALETHLFQRFFIGELRALKVI
jgi:hypothetical protein